MIQITEEHGEYLIPTHPDTCNPARMGLYPHFCSFAGKITNLIKSVLVFLWLHTNQTQPSPSPKGGGNRPTPQAAW